MKRIVAAGLAAVFVIIAGVVVAEPGWGPGAGPGNCNGCGRGQGMGGAGRMYDPARVEVVAGQVVSLDQIEGRRGPGMGVVLTMKTGSETLSVHLGPQWFMDKQDVKLAAGDSVEIKGAKSTRRGENVFIAAEVKKDGAVLKLRDENGVPVWAGWRRGENKS